MITIIITIFIFIIILWCVFFVVVEKTNRNVSFVVCFHVSRALTSGVLLNSHVKGVCSTEHCVYFDKDECFKNKIKMYVQILTAGTP